MQVHIFNNAPVMLDVKGTDGNTYFLPPKKISKLPSGVTVEGSMHKNLKVTKPPRA